MTHVLISVCVEKQLFSILTTSHIAVGRRRKQAIWSAPINSRLNVVVRFPLRLGWVEMAVGLPEGPSYPGHSPSFFRYAAP